LGLLLSNTSPLSRKSQKRGFAPPHLPARGWNLGNLVHRVCLVCLVYWSTPCQNDKRSQDKPLTGSLYDA
ncbi:MAG: hypothetical protein OEV17_11775, partial [Nitrospira sp.]|nr:hypothetical protein [Nitrospira sp.]